MFKINIYTQYGEGNFRFITQTPHWSSVINVLQAGLTYQRRNVRINASKDGKTADVFLSFK